MTTVGARHSSLMLERSVTLVVVATVLTLYALEGGTYDLVDRGQSAVLIWWILGLGVTFGMLPRRRFGPAAWIVAGGFALLLVLTVIAFSTTESDERTSVELVRTLHHLGAFLLVAATLRRRTAVAAIGGAAVAGALVCVLAVLSRTIPEVFPTDEVAREFDLDRLNYPLNYWNAVGAWGAMTAAMALALSTGVRAVALRSLALAAVPVAVTTVYLTYSRAGAAGVGLGVLVVLFAGHARTVLIVHLILASTASTLVIFAIRGEPAIANATGGAGGGTVIAVLLLGAAFCAGGAYFLARIGAERRWRLERQTAATVAAFIGVAVVLGAAALLPGLLQRAVADFNDVQASPGAGQADPAARLTSLAGTRRLTYESALAAGRQRLLEGIGPGSYEFWWNRDARGTDELRDAHSLFLEHFAELGIPGLLAMMVICGGALSAMMRKRSHAHRPEYVGAMAAALSGFSLWMFHAAVDWMWEMTAVTTLAMVLAGAAVATRTRPTSRRRPSAWRVGGAFACLLAAFVQLPPLIATSRVRESQDAAARGDVQAAQLAAQDAVDVWPWAATPFVQRALVAELRGDYSAATVDAERAERREATNWRHPLLLARLAAKEGRAGVAIGAYRRARDLRPLGRVFMNASPP